MSDTQQYDSNAYADNTVLPIGNLSGGLSTESTGHLNDSNQAATSAIDRVTEATINQHLKRTYGKPGQDKEKEMQRFYRIMLDAENRTQRQLSDDLRGDVDTATSPFSPNPRNLAGEKSTPIPDDIELRIGSTVNTAGTANNASKADQSAAGVQHDASSRVAAIESLFGISNYDEDENDDDDDNDTATIARITIRRKLGLILQKCPKVLSLALPCVRLPHHHPS